MKNLKGKSVKIDAERYFQLLKAEDELSALEQVGVDNWSGYGEHTEYLENEDDLLDEVFANVLI